MTSYTTGLIVGNREFCLFSMNPYSEITSDHVSQIDAVMTELLSKIHQDPERLMEVFPIQHHLISILGPKIYVELEKPMHVGVGYIVHAIQQSGVPVKLYFRQE
jgi:hypothetical protein